MPIAQWIDEKLYEDERDGYRYENDDYHQIEHHDLERVPGNPWFITSMWLTE